MMILSRDREPPRARRRGTMLLEVTVTAILLGAALVLVARVVGGLAAAHEATEARRWALREAQNLLERLSCQPWDHLATAGAAESWSDSASRRAAEALPGGRVEVLVNEVADDPDARRVAVAIHWDGPAGRPTRPVRLVAWFHRHLPGGER